MGFAAALAPLLALGGGAAAAVSAFKPPKPKMPKPPDPTPKVETPGAETEMFRRRKNRGRGSTILAGDLAPGEQFGSGSLLG